MVSPEFANWRRLGLVNDKSPSPPSRLRLATPKLTLSTQTRGHRIAKPQPKKLWISRIVSWGSDAGASLKQNNHDDVDNIIARVEQRRDRLYSQGGDNGRHDLGNLRVTHSQPGAWDNNQNLTGDTNRAELTDAHREIERLRQYMEVLEQQAQEAVQLRQDVIRYRQAAQEAAADRDDLEYELLELKKSISKQTLLEDDRLRYQRALEDTLDEERRQWERERAQERIEWQQDLQDRIDKAVDEVSRRLQIRHQQELEVAVNEETFRVEQQYAAKLEQMRRDEDDLADVQRLVNHKQLELTRLSTDTAQQRLLLQHQAQQIDEEKRQLQELRDETNKQSQRLQDMVAKVETTSRELNRMTLDVASVSTVMTAMIRWGLAVLDESYNLDDIVARINRLMERGVVLEPLSPLDQRTIAAMSQSQLDQEYRYLIGEEIPGWGFTYDRDPTRQGPRQHLLNSYVYLQAVVERLRTILLELLRQASAMPAKEFAQVVKLWESERFELMTCRRVLKWGSLPLRPHQR